MAVNRIRKRDISVVQINKLIKQQIARSNVTPPSFVSLSSSGTFNPTGAVATPTDGVSELDSYVLTTTFNDTLALYYTKSDCDGLFVTLGANNTWTGANHFGSVVLGGPTTILGTTLSANTTLSATGSSYYGLNSSGAAFTVKLPVTAIVTGLQIQLKDESGSCATNNVTIDGNGNNVEGATAFILSANYARVTLRWTGSQWVVIG